VKGELNRLSAELKSRLPEHTYTAVLRRAKALGSDRARRDLLAGILERRELAEKAEAS
jgi:hypothetical protein